MKYKIKKANGCMTLTIVVIFIVAIAAGAFAYKKYFQKKSVQASTTSQSIEAKKSSEVSTSTQTAQPGDTVTIIYTGKLKNGTIFDSTANKKPLQVTLGANQVIPGFEEGLIGLKKEERKIVEIPADKAYGPVRKELIKSIERKNINEKEVPKVGQLMQLKTEQNVSIPAKVIKVTDDTIVFDLNHPLTGQDLIFDLKIIDIQ